jgi:Nucleotidyl transferase AbiEii toxin, Type IV TA system
MFQPHLEILPPAQLRLWPELSATPADFVLYGGTAIALRLAHRFSVDFDFFSTVPFTPADLKESVPYLQGGTLRKSSANTLTVSVDRGAPVQLSFFGGLRVGQVAPHDVLADPTISVASLVDLAGMKVAVVTQRAEVKDYLDIHALLTVAGIDLSTMLAAAGIIYGGEFNPLISLKAITYHDDPALADLPQTIRRDLLVAVRSTRVNALPQLTAVRLKEDRP